MKLAIMSDKPITDQMKNQLIYLFETSYCPNESMRSLPWVKDFNGTVVYTTEPDKCEYKEIIDVEERK